jgi:hypothetical protein
MQHFNYYKIEKTYQKKRHSHLPYPIFYGKVWVW